MAEREKIPRSLGKASCVRETAKALLIVLDGDDEERWIPKSVVHANSEVFSVNPPNDEGDLVVDDWWAEQCEWCD